MGDTLICSHIRRLGPFLGVQNLELHFFCVCGGGGGGGVQKNEYFWGHHKT